MTIQLKTMIEDYKNQDARVDEVLFQEVMKLVKMLEGNDGMSVKEIRAQFVVMHRDYLSDYSKLENENKRLREQLELIRKDTFATEEDERYVSAKYLIRKRVDKALEHTK